MKNHYGSEIEKNLVECKVEGRRRRKKTAETIYYCAIKKIPAATNGLGLDIEWMVYIKKSNYIFLLQHPWKQYILSINPMALPEQTPLIIIDNDENNDNERLTDQQLLNHTARYLSILEQRVHDEYCNISPHQIQVLATRRQMLAILRMILNKSQHLVYSGIAQGFVFGLITENKIWTASSDDLRGWWKEDVNFEQNGPRALLSMNVSETLGLESLKELQDVTLSSIISALMRKCTPSQRSFPFYFGKPVGWWPTGTEEWWSQLNFPEDLGPPEYKKPHDLKKQWKVAVLVAAIKNLEPDFQKIRRLVCQSQTVQNKMTHKENSIWLAVVRGEEMEMRRKLHLSDPESDISHVDVKVLGSSRTQSNIEDTIDKEREVCLVPQSLIKVENGDIDKETEALPSSSLLKGETSEVNKLNRIAIREPEMIPVRSSTTSQGPILETVGSAASEGESSSRQKLKGIAAVEPEILKLPKHQSDGCPGSSNFSQGSMNANHQFPHQFQTDDVVHPSYASAMSNHPSNYTLRPPLASSTMPCHEPGCFGFPTLFGSINNQGNCFNFGGQTSNNNQANSSNFGGQTSDNNQVNPFKFGGQVSNDNTTNSNFAGRTLKNNQVNTFNRGCPNNGQVNSCNFGGQIFGNDHVNSSGIGGQMSDNGQVNYSNFAGQILSNNQLNSANFGGQMTSNNQLNSCNYGGQMRNNNQLNSSNFGGQMPIYSNSTANGVNVSSLNVASVAQSSNFSQTRNDQVLSAELPTMQMTGSADATMPNLELDGVDCESTPFADSDMTTDFNFDLDCFTGGEEARMMQQPNGSDFDWNI